MGTKAEEIFDLFLSKINDTKLILLYQTSGSGALNLYLQPWLINSITDFDICDQDITYDINLQEFEQILSIKNKNVLSRIMTKYWLERQIQDILQMNNYIQDKDYKTHSMANSLKEKRELYILKCEEIDNLLINYALKYDVDWTQWQSQNFI